METNDISIPYATRHCGLKHVYYTKKEAIEEVNKQISQYHHKRYYYRCEFCGWYHLSKHKKKLKKYEIKSMNIVIWR